ncbi:MAG: porin [Flavobacterium lindanitolerans]|uniref:porin n=1 Tax=Flavobacterium lindanitolerans TaxID=428988 RepID=UPI001A3D2E9C|nr:porin [Flavobacterium lindanitolerans]MBL7868312.1 porin [Flavobacterium lindanitolerans]
MDIFRNFQNAVLKISFLICLLSSDGVFSQTSQADENEKKEATTYPKFSVKGLFQGQYVASLNTNVDINGLHHSDGEEVSNTFLVKRGRLQVKAIISDRTDVTMSVNLADFKSDPKNKVLENAYISYKLTDKISLTAGQFRPFFGLENTYPIDIVKSIDFSNQYYEFGNNGWESFQIGASVSVRDSIGRMPVQYGLTVFNGNGRNQNNDKDNGKQYAGRVLFRLSEKNNVNLGLNGGLGQVFHKDVYAAGFDITSNFSLSEKFLLELQLEAKQGTNHNLFFNLQPEERIYNLNRYQTRGFYFLPNLRYDIQYRRLSSIEFSCRYEYLDSSYRVNSNLRQTWLPMLSLEFLKSYNARIQLAMQIDDYKRNVPDTPKYDNKLFILQVQSRF